MVYRTVVVLSCLGLAAAGFPQGRCDDSSPGSQTCCDVTQTTNAKCVKHVRWAMSAGVAKYPRWYSDYHVHKGGTFADFQCALFWIKNDKVNDARDGVPTDHHSCSRPCTATVMNGCNRPSAKIAKINATCPERVTAPDCNCGHTAVGVSSVCPGGDVTLCEPRLDCTQDSCTPDCPSLKPWMIALIVTAVLALLAALAYFLSLPKEKKKPKKRALAPPPAPPVEPAPTPAAPQPASYTMRPVMMMQAPPTTMVQQPMMTMVQPVQTYSVPQPVQHIVAPPTTAIVAQQPMMTIAQPVQNMVQTYAAPHGMPGAQQVQYR